MLKQIIASRIVNIILVVSLSTQSVLSAIPVNAESDYNSLNLSNVSQESNSQETGGFFDFIFSFFKINNNNTVKEYNPNDLVNNQDLFGYMPGEIIVKFKHSNDLHNAEHAIKYQMDLEFDATNIDTEAVIPVLEEKKQGLHMNSYEDYVSVQKAELVGLDRMYNIDIPGLQRKSELFIERFKMELSKLPVEQAHEGVEQRIVSVPTQEFGMVSINISNQEYIIDPFTLQLLDELRERSDVEYADVNARVYINNDLVIEPAIQEPQDLQEDVIEIEIPVETPDKSDSNNEEQIIIEIPDIIEEVEDIEEVVEEIENTEENLENEDKSIFKSIIDLIVAPIQEVIEIIEPDVSEEIEDPIDALFEEQWALHNIGQSYHTGPDNTSTGSADVDINFLETYKEVDYNKGEGVVVAVIDTGISYTNEEIDDNLWINQSEIPVTLFSQIDDNSDGEVTSREILTYIELVGMDVNLDGKYNFKDVLHPNSDFINNIDEDGDGYTDDIIGYDFVVNEYEEDGILDLGSDSDPYDWHGHGTHVSGTIAAEANEIGIIGIAPKAKIMSLRGLNSYGGGSIADLIDSVYYAANHGADITNNSWGGGGSYQPLSDAFDYADSMGTVSVAASGNDSQDVANHLPANIESVISVGSHTSRGSKSGFSNYGSILDIAAPGSNTISLLSEGSYMEANYQPYIYEGYLIISGTSMASPHIAGILAGIKSSSSVELDTQRARALLKISQKNDNQFFTEDFGYGKIDQKKMFDSRDSVLPVVNITNPINGSVISGLQNLEASISGEYESVTVTASGARSGDDVDLIEVCSSAVFETCEISTSHFKDGQDYSFEIRLSDVDGNIISRDAVVASINNLDLILSDSKPLYGSKDTLSFYYSIGIDSQDVDYRVAIEPILPSGDRITLVEDSSNENVYELFELNVSDLPSSGKYKLVLEVDYPDGEGGINRSIDSKLMYVDFGLKDNFPVSHDADKIVSNFTPIQILNLDESSESNQIYSPKSECTDIGGGWVSCPNKSELWKVDSQGEIKDIMPDIGFDSLEGDWSYILGSSSSDKNSLDLKLYNISGAGNGGATREPGSVAHVENDSSIEWNSEIEDSFDSWDDARMILSQDMDNDGTVETVFMKQNYWYGEQFIDIYILDENGDQVSNILVSDEQDSRYSRGMIIGNFDEDLNTKEILTTTIVPTCDDNGCTFNPPKEYQINVYDIQGDKLWSQSISPTEDEYNIFIEDGPYSVDIDSDSIDEIVFVKSRSGNGTFLDVYSNTGEFVGSYKTDPNGAYGRNTKITFGDINSDGKTDALVTNGIYYTAITLDGGDKIFQKEISEPRHDKRHITIDDVMIADFNNDDSQEIMFMTGTRWWLDGGDPIPNTIRLFDESGDEIINDNFPRVYPNIRSDTGESIGYDDVLGMIYPQITDIDNDGTIDLVFQTVADYYLENTYYVTELGGDASTIQADGSYMLNQGRTGHYENPNEVVTPVALVDTPTHLSANPQDKSAMIYWNEGVLVSEDIVGYNIYQSLDYQIFELDPINNKLVEDTEYKVKKLDNDVTHYFAVTAVDIDGNESELSDPIIITPYQGSYMQFGEEIEIPHNGPYPDTAIFGDKLVWIMNMGDVSFIQMYDTQTREIEWIAHDLEGYVHYLDIDGDNIVWSQTYNDEGNIYSYNIQTKQQIIVSDDVHNNYSYDPQVFGDYVVWYGYDGSKNNIYLNDLETGISEKVSTGLDNAHNPKIYGRKIIYTDTSSSLVSDIYLYDIDTKEQIKIVEGIESYIKTDFYGSSVVWTSEYGGEMSIRLYDLKTQEIKNIGYTNSTQSNVSIHNNKIVWMEEKGSEYGPYNNIHMYDLGTNNEYQITSNTKVENNPIVYGDTIVWEKNTGSGIFLYMKKVYTVPDSPINPTVEGDKETPEFDIDWENPYDPSGMYGAWYKLGDAPESDEDGIFTTEKPFIATATEKNQKLHVWLENNDRHKNYKSFEKVVLNYNPKDNDDDKKKKPPIPIFIPPSSGGGGGGGNSTTPSLRNVQKFLQTKDGTQITSQESKVSENGIVVEELVKSSIKLSDNPTNSQSVRLGTANTAVVKEMTFELSTNTLKEFASAFGVEKEFEVVVTSKEAEQNQKTNYARQDLYLEGFDVFSVNISVGRDVIDSFANPAELTFDISDVNYNKNDLKIYYFSETNGTWVKAGDGGTVAGNKISVQVDHLTDFGIIREVSENGVGGSDIAPEDQWQQIKSEAEMIANSGLTPEKLNALILYTGNTKNLDSQIHWTDSFSAKISNQNKLDKNQMFAVNNFIVYGTNSTQNLGAGERAGVISSYQNVYNKLPVTVDDWVDCIAIASGRWPNERSLTAEQKAINSFSKIYKRAPNMDNSHDNAAVTVMAYGLRGMQRNIDSEKSTIKLFKRIFSHNPLNALDWNIVRAITYSGASR